MNLFQQLSQRKILLVSALAIGWFIIGLSLSAKPSWWDPVFSVLVIYVMWSAWRHLEKETQQDIKEMEDNPRPTSYAREKRMSYGRHAGKHPSDKDGVAAAHAAVGMSPDELTNFAEMLRQKANPSLLPASSQFIQAYSSLEEAQKYGWVFSDQVGHIGATPLYREAHFDNQVFVFDGLSTPRVKLLPWQVVFKNIRFTLKHKSEETHQSEDSKQDE